MKNKHIYIHKLSLAKYVVSRKRTWWKLINISVTVASSVSITALSRGRMEEWGENLDWQYQQGDDLLRMLAHSYKSNLCTGLWGGGVGGRFEWQQQIYEALFVSLSKGKWHLYSSVRETYPDPSIWARKFKAFYCGGLWNRVNSGRNVFACVRVGMLHWYRMFLGIVIIIISRQPEVNFLHSWAVVSPKFPVRSSL